MARAERRRAASIVRVAVACSPRAGDAFEVTLELPAPATALDAIRASGLLERHPELGLGEPLIGIWGRACALETALRDGDRVEIYRPLTVDPKEARRLRASERCARSGAPLSAPLLAVGRRSLPGRGVISSARCLSSRNSRSPVLALVRRQADAAVERRHLRARAAAVVGLQRGDSFLARPCSWRRLRLRPSCASPRAPGRPLRGAERSRWRPRAGAGAGDRRGAGRRAPAHRRRSAGQDVLSGVPAGGGRSLYWTWPPLSRHFHCAAAGRAIRLSRERAASRATKRSGHGRDSAA